MEGINKLKKGQIQIVRRWLRQCRQGEIDCGIWIKGIRKIKNDRKPLIRNDWIKKYKVLHYLPFLSI